MDFIRIGDKIINKAKLWAQIEKILDLRVKGVSQQEAARQMSLDRAFISRLESLGEVRKGHRIAVIGFPIKNREELLKMLEKEGVEFSLILSEEERWAFVREPSGLDLFNKVMELTAELHRFDCLVVLASNKRIKLFQSLFNNEVVGVEIGQSPIEEDKIVEIEQVQKLIQTLKEVGKQGG
ncbi:transcriptional regulator [Candidatus Formimonas warabiya]|uniref:Transcriptional regulator n=1 Tax=Formimonas warabiya TaxID=1761012 RepID=A0A3G1KX54_FORW1|nr:transcriptional regulator [Candidatus Formimonas warabiya]ATW27068.1 transcriptional regulator [Candidatus Formimonas warabiya]